MTILDTTSLTHPSPSMYVQATSQRPPVYNNGTYIDLLDDEPERTVAPVSNHNNNGTYTTDFLSSEPERAVVPFIPTATSVHDPSLPTYRDEENSHSKVVVIPPSNVYLDESSSPPNYDSSSQNMTMAQYGQYNTNSGPSPLAPTQRYVNGRPVKPKNAHLPDEVLRFKDNRKLRTAVSTWTGGTIGLIAFGPLGAVAGATGAYAISKSVGKHREKKLLRRCEEQQQFEQQPSATAATHAHYHENSCVLVDRAEFA